MMTETFAEEVAARMAETTDDVDLTTAPVFGIVYHDAEFAPVAIDVYAGTAKDVRMAGESMCLTFGYSFYTLVPFGVLDEPRPKSSLIMETAVRVAG